MIPVNGATKKPTIPSWTEYQTRHATEDEVRAWDKAGLLKGIAIVTGKISGITVVDVDTEEADREFQEACGDTLLETPTVKTPNGGKHYYFKYDPQLKTKAGYRPNIDIRNDGGYVIAPPTMNGNGNGYIFMPWLGIEVDC